MIRPAITSFLLILILVTTGYHCQRSTISPGVRFTGKLVISGPCSHYIVQVLDGPVDSTRVTGSWHNPTTGITYNNVFEIANPCTFAATVMKDSLSVGNLFTFELDPAPPEEECFICLIYSPAPPAKNSVKNIIIPAY